MFAGSVGFGVEVCLGFFCYCVCFVLLVFFNSSSEEKHNNDESSANFSKIGRQSSLLGSIIIKSKLHLSK